MKLEEAIKSTNFKSEKDKALLHIMFTAYQLKTRVSSTLKPFGLTTEQYNVLRILKGKHPEALCVKNIAGRMIERSSNVPRIIDRLVAKKLVKRSQNKDDKRETVIALNESGLKLLELSTVQMNADSAASFLITNEEASVMNNLLEKINAD